MPAGVPPQDQRLLAVAIEPQQQHGAFLFQPQREQRTRTRRRLGAGQERARMPQVRRFRSARRAFEALRIRPRPHQHRALAAGLGARQFGDRLYFLAPRLFEGFGMSYEWNKPTLRLVP